MARGLGVQPPAHPLSRTVTKVGKRLVATLDSLPAQDQPTHLQESTWDFTVIDSPEVNAFVVRTSLATRPHVHVATARSRKRRPPFLPLLGMLHVSSGARNEHGGR